MIAPIPREIRSVAPNERFRCCPSEPSSASLSTTSSDFRRSMFTVLPIVMKDDDGTLFYLSQAVSVLLNLFNNAKVLRTVFRRKGGWRVLQNALGEILYFSFVGVLRGKLFIVFSVALQQMDPE